MKVGHCKIYVVLHTIEHCQKNDNLLQQRKLKPFDARHDAVAELNGGLMRIP